MKHPNPVGRASVDGVMRYVRVDGDLVTPLAIDGMGVTGPLLSSGQLWTAMADGKERSLESVRLSAPVVGTRKVIGIGLNYAEHAAEGGETPPGGPLVFAKFPSAIVGPDEPITFSRNVTEGVDLEAELGVVVGMVAQAVSVERALHHVGAYTCLNDVSARDLQFGDGQWVRGKSLDTFCPMGPWLVHPDSLGVPGPQQIQGAIGDEVLQDAVLSDMIFGVAELIAWLSHNFTLEPGDVIATGTPSGVGWFRNPRRVLQDDDVVTITIDGIGSLRNRVRILD